MFVIVKLSEILKIMNTVANDSHYTYNYYFTQSLCNVIVRYLMCGYE